MFRQRPALAPQLLTSAFGLDLPAYDAARLEPGDFTDLIPTEYRADAVVTLTAPSSGPTTAAVLAVIVEVQLGKDAGKRWSWPVYLASLRARLRCPTVLLIVCADDATSAWCARGIDLGHPGFVLTPLVLGPGRIPVVTDLDQARRTPEVTVLSVMAHGTNPADPHHEELLAALLDALDAVHAIDQSRSLLYFEVVAAALPAAVRSHLEVLMSASTYEFQSDFARRHFAKGEAQGEAHAVLEFLNARGVDVPESARTRIAACTDLDTLGTWIRRAATATSVDDLFR